MNCKNTLFFGAAICAAALCGCASFLPQRDGADEVVLPSGYSEITESKKTVSLPVRMWWKDFGNGELDGLIDSGFAENITLRQAWARLKQANSTAAKAGAGLYPSLSAVAGAERSRSVQTLNPEKSEKTGATLSEYSFGLAASYEIDLWGRIRDGRRASLLDAAASRKSFESAAITVSAEITDRWLKIIEQREQIKLLRAQLDTNKKSLTVIEDRVPSGKATALDVYQQRQTVAQVEAQIPLAEASEKTLVHELNFLLGRPASAGININTGMLPALPPLPDLGLPADLLRNRPDVRAAMLKLHSADWSVAAARADRLPAISLTGTYTNKGDQVSRLFDNWFLNLASSLTAPLLDGSRRSEEVKRTLAVTEERLAAYRETVLTAFKEVEDALVRQSKQDEYLNALNKQLVAANNTLKEARLRYFKNQGDFLAVQTSLLAVQKNERDLLSAKRVLLGYRVALYRALGGTWTENFVIGKVSGIPKAEIMEDTKD